MYAYGVSCMADIVSASPLVPKDWCTVGSFLTTKLISYIRYFVNERKARQQYASTRFRFLLATTVNGKRRSFSRPCKAFLVHGDTFCIITGTPSEKKFCLYPFVCHSRPTYVQYMDQVTYECCKKTK